MSGREERQGPAGKEEPASPSPCTVIGFPACSVRRILARAGGEKENRGRLTSEALQGAQGHFILRLPLPIILPLDMPQGRGGQRGREVPHSFLKTCAPFVRSAAL